MSRLGSVAILLALGTFTAASYAQDNGEALPEGLPPFANHDAPVSSVTNPAPPSWEPSPGSEASPIRSTTTGGLVNTLRTPGPAPVIKADPKKADPKRPGPIPFPVGGVGGGGGGGGGRSQFVNTELKYGDEGKGDPNAAKTAKESPGGSKTGGPGSGPGGSSPTASATGPRGSSDGELPGLPSPGAKAAGPTPAPTPATPKKGFLEGHVVLFLRAPGDEDPSPAGVKARFSKEAKIVQRVAGEVQRGEKPSTKPEEAVLRDAAPQGFYLPDEVDAWLVTTDGTMVLLESEGTTFDKIAALALSSRLNVAGSQTPVDFDGVACTKVKVVAMSTDGSEPRTDSGAKLSDGGTDE